MRVSYPSDVNSDYSLLSRALFALFLSLACAFAGWLAQRASFIAVSLRDGGAASWTVALACILPAVVYLARRRKKARLERHQSEAIHLQRLVIPLAKELGIEAPAVRISPTESDARVVVSGRSAFLLVPRAMELLARVDPESIRPVVIHELAHIRNGDARAAQVAQAVIGVALLAVGVVQGAEFLAYADGLRVFAQRYGWKAVGIYEAGSVVGTVAWIIPFATALVLSYMAFLRMREFEADRVVATFGFGEHMAAALLRTTNPVKNWLRVHPSAAQRAKSLRERTSIHSVEYQTVGLVSAVAWIVSTSASSIAEGALGYLAFGFGTIMGLAVLCLLGVNLGRRLRTDDISFVARVRELAKAYLAVLAGTTAAAISLGMLMNFTAGAPVQLQAWEAMLKGLAAALALSNALFLCYLIGSATTCRLSPVGWIRHLWLLMGFVLSMIGYALIFSLASAALDPYGIRFEVNFWMAASGALEAISKIESGIPPLTNWKIGPEGFAFVTIVLVASTFLCLFLGLEAIRTISQRIQETMVKSRMFQLTLWIALNIAVLSAVALVTGLAIDTGKELRMNRSMWISCSAADAGGISEASHEATQAAEAFARQVVKEVDAIQTLPTQSPGVFVGMREHGCNAYKMQRYPAIRALLARLGAVDDIFVNIDFSGTSIYLETQLGSANETNRIPLLYGKNAYGVARAIVHWHMPYRTALRELQESTISRPTAESPLLMVMSHPDIRQRAWALNTYGNALVASNPEEAGKHLMRAIELLPGEATFRSSYAYLLLLNNRCDEAGPHVRFAASAGRLGSLLALGYARCLRNAGRPDEALGLLWKLKGLYTNDALFAAALGEMAIWANQRILARDWLGEAVRLAGDKPPPACARLFNELIKRPDICNSDRCTAPLPVENMTPEEKICWASYSARYGHRFGAP